MHRQNFKLGQMKLVIAVILVSVQFVLGQDTFETKLHATHATLQKEQSLYVVHRRPKSILRNSLYFELGGSGGFGSFNFEWNFAAKNKYRWMLRTGISGTYIDKNNGAAFIFPVMVHGVYGKTHGLDIGLGQALTVTTKGAIFLRAPLSIGYRWEPTGKRLFYRFSYTPIISYIVDFQWEHWGGITIGYKLNTVAKF